MQKLRHRFFEKKGHVSKHTKRREREKSKNAGYARDTLFASTDGPLDFIKRS